MHRDFRKAENILPVLVAISTLFTPYAVQQYTTAIFAHGFIWYFPLWRLYLGYGGSGVFAYIIPLGTAEFPLIGLEPLVASVLLAVGFFLAVIIWREGNDAHRDSMRWFSALAALLVQISMPVLATLSSPPSIWMLTGLVPTPITGLLALFGRVYLHRTNRW